MRKPNWPFIGRALARFACYAALLAYIYLAWLGAVSIFTKGEHHMQDKPLFGPVDQVVNTLEIEISWVKGEIKRREGAIERNREEITLLQTRLDNLSESMKIVRESEKKREEAEARKPAAKTGTKTPKTTKARKS